VSSVAASSRLGAWFSLVAFRHSIFALPFALQGAWLAARGAPRASLLVWIVVCAVAARTSAMAFNRWIDRRLDARNPRTAGRELPSGKLTPAQALTLASLSAAVFVAAAFALNPLCGKLSPAVLAVLWFYSLTKRFTFLAHGFLGLALSLAPLGAWLAVRGDFAGDLWRPISLAAAVLCWVAGFDLIYACQDARFDRESGLHSIPARFGIAASLRVSRLLHAATVLLLAMTWRRADLGWIYLAGIALAACLLVYEQSLVRADDLSRVDMAFFTVNGWIGVGLFAALVLDFAFDNPRLF
jgi:4-hydroxybenzoate polyprenyltransferase